MRKFFPALIAAGMTAALAQDLTLREALDLALRSHPILTASDERIQAAAGFKTQAGLKPNPVLVYQQENWRATTNNFHPGRDLDSFLYVQQRFEPGGKRLRRVDLSAAEQKRLEISRELVSREIAARVKDSYWTAAGAKRILELLRETVKNYDRIVEYHALRVREGVMAEADLLKVQLERDRVLAQVNAANLDVEKSRIALFRDMGLAEFPAGGVAETIDNAPAPPTSDVAAALTSRSEVKLANQSVATAKANAQLQQANAKQDFEGLFGYKRTGGLDTMLVGLQVPLPVRNRNQGNIVAADAGVRAAEAESAAAKALVAAEVRFAAADAQLKYKQIRELFPELLKKAEETARIAEAAYREGGTDLLRLLDAERVRIDANLQYAQTLAEYRRSLAALETAMGVNP